MAQIVPVWLITRLINTAADEPQWENSFYGPFNGVLTSAFGRSSRVFIKPQAPLRALFDGQGQSSEDEYGVRIPSRAAGGQPSAKAPDLVACLVAQGRDIVALGVEIKRANQDADRLEQQVRGYLRQFAQRARLGDVNPRAVTLAGEDLRPYELVVPQLPPGFLAAAAPGAQPPHMDNPQAAVIHMGGDQGFGWLVNWLIEVRAAFAHLIQPVVELAQDPHSLDWVLDRLNTTALGPHLEGSLYGPANFLLCWFFSPVDGYLVKPQAVLRADWTHSSGDEMDRSWNSMGGPRLPKSATGMNETIHKTDFLVALTPFTQATPGNPAVPSGALNDDTPKVLWELKSYRSRANASLQVTRDMEKVAQTTQPGTKIRNLRGITLERNSRFRIWVMARAGSRPLRDEIMDNITTGVLRVGTHLLPYLSRIRAVA